MSVSSVDRNSQATETQAAREAYEENAKSQEARHKKQVAQLQKHYAEEIEDLRNQYSESLDDVRNTTRQSLSEKEKQHLREIQEMQDVSRKRSARNREETEEKITRLQQGTTEEKERITRKNADDMRRLYAAQEKERQDKSRETSEYVEGLRESQSEAVEGKGKKYEEALSARDREHQNIYQKSMKETGDDRDRMMRFYTKELKDRDNALSSQKDAASKKTMAMVQQERSEYNDNLAHFRDGYQETLDEVKDRYQKKGTELSEKFDSDFENLRGEVDRRVETQIQSRDLENTELRRRNNFDSQNLKRIGETEKRNLTKAFGENIDELEKRRVAAVDDSNKKNANDITNVHRGYERLIDMKDRRNNEKIADEKSVTMSFEEKAAQAEREKSILRTQTELQKKQISEDFADRLIAQQQFYEAQIDKLHSDHDTNMQEQRVSLEQRREQDLNNLRNVMAKSEIDHSEKLSTTVKTYEKALSDMRSDYEKRFRRQDELNRDISQKQQKTAQTERETLEEKHKMLLAQTKESYERQMETLRKRQIEERQKSAMKS